jgi:hypothetical protein
MSTYPLENSAYRVERVLTQVGWPIPAMLGIEPGLHNVQAAGAELNQTPALTHLQAVESAENGSLFIKADGRLIFNNELYPDLRVVTFTFGDAPGEIHYQKRPDIGLDGIDLYNAAHITRVTGPNDATPPPTQTYFDSTSELEYSETSTYVDSSILLTTDAETHGRAALVVNRYKQPFARVRQIVVDPLSDPSVCFPAIVALDMVDRVTFKRRPWDSVSQSFGAPAFSQDQHIEGVMHEIDTAPQSWRTTYTMFPAGPFSAAPLVAAVVHEATVQSIPDATDTVVLFDTLDAGAVLVVALAPTSTITIPATYAGDYTVSFAASIDIASLPIVFVRKTDHTASSGTTMTVTLSAPSVAGHQLILCAMLDSGAAATIVTVTDSGGNTWRSWFAEAPANPDLEVWAVQADAAVTTVTLTFSSAVSAAAVRVLEFSGVNAASGAVSAVGSGTGTAADSTPVTSSAGGLAIGAIGVADVTATLSGQTAGFTVQSPDLTAGAAPGVVLDTAYKLNSLVTEDYAATLNHSADWLALVAIFLPLDPPTAVITAKVTKNGGALLSGAPVTGSGSVTSSGGDVVTLAVGDVLRLIARQVSGGAQNTDVSSVTRCFLSVSNV